MSQPTPYNRLSSFTTIQQEAPTAPLPGDDLDAELNAVKQTLDEVLNNLELIQRDDGELGNETVGRDQLQDNIQLGFNAPTAWNDETSYTTLDTTFFEGKFYSCIVAHISTAVFADDLASGYWELIADFAGVLGSAVNVEFTPAGNISSDNVQEAVEEVQADVDTINAMTILASPGTTTTQAISDDSTKVATTAFVHNVFAAALPAGLGPLPWSGRLEPAGWVFANGQTLLRASYPALWAFAETEIGAGNSLYTNGNGTTTFTVPNIKGRIPVAKDDMGGTAAAGLVTSAGSGLDGLTLGAAGGAQNHVITQAQLPNVTLATAIASGQGSHTHTATTSATAGASSGAPGGGNNLTAGGASVTVNANTLPAMTGTTPLGGSGTAHTNVQPSMIFNMIIATGVYTA
jgi:microcystin-dependent protein